MWTTPLLIVTVWSALLIAGPVLAMSIEVEGNRVVMAGPVLGEAVLHGADFWLLRFSYRTCSWRAPSPILTCRASVPRPTRIAITTATTPASPASAQL
jgi:hypothetical protein